MQSFDDLKNSNKVNIENLVKQAEQATGGKKSYEDDRFWKPTRDKSGNGYAVIRFLPAPDQPTPWVQYFDHFFKGPSGLWYVEKSLTTFGEPDPVAEANKELWNRAAATKDEEKRNQDIVRSRKRKLHYVANILVIKDPANPENDGKVFLYDFGAKIFGKICGAMQPEFPDQEPFNPFDMWKGADFSIRIKMQGEGQKKFPNYDESSFAAPNELLGGDNDKLKEIYESCHKVGEFIDPTKYKSYAELDKKFQQVLGNTNAPTASDVVTPQESKPNPTLDARPAFGEGSNSISVPEETSDDLEGDLKFFDKAIDDED